MRGVKTKLVRRLVLVWQETKAPEAQLSRATMKRKAEACIRRWRVNTVDGLARAWARRTA